MPEDWKHNTTIMNEGIRTQEVKKCLLCNNKGVLLYQDLRDRLFGAPGVWKLLRCPKCSFVWLNPCPIPEDIGKLYSTYFTHNTIDEVVTKGPNSLRRKIKRSILKSAFAYHNVNTSKSLGWLASRFGPLRAIAGGGVMWLNGSSPGKLLDVGCGSGQFLSIMQKLGWKVVSVEPDGQAVKVAREQFGLSAHEGSINDAGFPDNTFDAITMSHVVEHLPDPINTLKECCRVLSPGGRLVITTPNIESLGHRLYQKAWQDLDPPRHLFLFSPNTLRTCAEPIAPKVKLNTIIGLILGLMLGIFLAFILEMVNRTIESREDVTEFLDLPVLGNIPSYEQANGKNGKKGKTLS